MSRITVKKLGEEIGMLEAKLRGVAHNKFNKITVTHANLNREIDLVADHISAVHIAKDETGKDAYTAIYTPSGAFPAKEKPEEVWQKLNDLKKEISDGI